MGKKSLHLSGGIGFTKRRILRGQAAPLGREGGFRICFNRERREGSFNQDNKKHESCYKGGRNPRFGECRVMLRRLYVLYKKVSSTHARDEKYSLRDTKGDPNSNRSGASVVFREKNGGAFREQVEGEQEKKLGSARHH